MEIRVLGPVEIRDERGELLPVTAPMPRGVLASLALRPGHVVLAGDLAYDLWGESLPHSVSGVLRNHVMRLRKALPPGLIATTSGGYQLRAEPHETDHGRLQHLRRSAREIAPRDPRQAAAHLAEGLALWRGSPLGGVPDCPLRAVHQPRLEELGLAASEEWYDLRLALGEHEDLVEELLLVSQRHPTRERFTRQLMLALHRGGRTAEALATYQRARSTLLDQLAIEPGTELRALEGAILRGDPELAMPATRFPPHAPPGSESAAVAPPLPAPRPAARAAASEAAPHRPVPAPRPPLPPQARPFPPALALFVARGTELARIRDWLTRVPKAPVVCLINGPGGVGKSSLAVQAAHEAADAFPDRLLHIDLRGADPQSPPLQPGDAVRQLLPSLGIGPEQVPADADAALARYHSALAEHPTLLVLDNAHSTRQAAPLVPTSPGSACLVTSRAVLPDLPGAHHLHLDVLEAADAIALVRSLSGRTESAADAADTAADTAATAAAADTGERAAWDALVALCGRLPLALNLVATRMASRPRWRVADWAESLRDERHRLDQLAVGDRDVRASLHLSIDQLAEGGELGDRRAAYLFPYLGAAAVRRYSPESVAALSGSDRTEAGDSLERLTDAQILYSSRPGSYALHDLVHTVAVGEAASLPRHEAEAALTRLAHWFLGTLHRSNRPLRLDERYELRHARGAVRFPEGLTFATPEQALAWVDTALDDILTLAEQLGQAPYDGQAAARPGAEGLVALSRFPLEALDAMESYFSIRLAWGAQRRLCQAVLRVSEQQGDDIGRATVYAQLGKAAGQSGRGSEGARYLRRAAALFREAGRWGEAAAATANQVPCLASDGFLKEAVTAGEEALTLIETSGLREGAHSLRNNLGLCHLHLGDHREAYRLLIETYEAADLAQYRSSSAGSLAQYHLSRQEHDDAEHWARRSLAHGVEQPFDPYAIAEQHAVLAASLEALGRVEEAGEEQGRALDMLADLNTREAVRLRLSLLPGAVED